MRKLLRPTQRNFEADLSTELGRALVEERYWSLQRQVPIVYLLGLVNLSALELATTGVVRLGLNLPTFVLACAVIRIFQWFRTDRLVTHGVMVRRMQQTVWFAAVVCLAVCGRCLYLIQIGDAPSQMAVMLFGGLTAIGVSYGLTALPLAGRIPLLLIIAPISIAALLSTDTRFAGAAFGLVAVAVLTMRLLTAHSRHFVDLIRSRSVAAREQEVAEHAHREAIVAASTDFLTDLPNRRAFITAVEKQMQGAPFALALLDLDRFKGVNDTFGHAAGDALLQEVASRLLRATSGLGVVARLGGDEFGVLLPGVSEASEARYIGNRVLAAVNGPARIKGRDLMISACCGLGLSRCSKDKSPSRVMADADLALYQAKSHASDAVAVFDLEMEAPRQRRVQIESALQSSAIRDNLSLVFQPIVDLRTGRVMANEALARWTDPELGSISPAEFVPIAEQLHLIDEINQSLMRMAFEEARNWPENTRLSYNLSAIQLRSPCFASAVLKAADKARLATSRLQIEVTETALLADFDPARQNITELRNAGATIVLDDFGAGYASIGYLRELRFDQIKLDGALVTAAQHSAEGKRLLQAVISLCEILGVSSVAEHVESAELLKLVMELGCTAAQGFWLMAPVAAEQLRSLSDLPQITAHSKRRRAA